MITEKDVIDVTHMTEEERREHFRRLDELTTCPCSKCQEECDHWTHISECERYQEWMQWALLGRKIRRRNEQPSVQKR